MQHLVTGATGIFGKRLVKSLLARRVSVMHFLLRPGSEGKLDALYDCWGAGRNRAVPVDDEILDTMLNDFGCLRVTKGLLPGMVAQDCISKPVRIATRLGITGLARAGLARAAAAHGADRHERQLPHVPRLVSGQG